MTAKQYLQPKKYQNNSHNYAVSFSLDMFSHTVKIALYSHAQKIIKLCNPFDFNDFQSRSISPSIVKLRSRRAWRKQILYQIPLHIPTHQHINYYYSFGSLPLIYYSAPLGVQDIVRIPQILHTKIRAKPKTEIPARN